MQLPWTGEFPYRCGVTPEDFSLWYTHVEFASKERVPDPIVLTDGHGIGLPASRIVELFCDDCASSYRRKAQARGACRRVVINEVGRG